jgi:hypothetical protein
LTNVATDTYDIIKVYLYTQTNHYKVFLNTKQKINKIHINNKNKYKNNNNNKNKNKNKVFINTIINKQITNTSFKIKTNTYSKYTKKYKQKYTTNHIIYQLTYYIKKIPNETLQKKPNGLGLPASPQNKTNKI